MEFRLRNRQGCREDAAASPHDMLSRAVAQAEVRIGHLRHPNIVLNYRRRHCGDSCL